MDDVELIIVIVLWLLFSYRISVMARDKGRDSTLYFLISFFISPLLAFIILLAQGRDSNHNSHSTKESHSEPYIELLEKELQLKNTGLKNNSDDKYEKLEKIGALLEKGILTKEEFQEEKGKIMSGATISNVQETSQPKFHFNDSFFKKLDLEISYAKNAYLNNQSTSLPDLLSEVISNQVQGVELLTQYKQRNRKSLIEELKETSSSYRSISRVLKVFIDHKIVEKEYPHKLLA